jgi:LysR family transcriptional regulator of gallate degradation
MIWKLNLRHLRAMAAVARLGTISAAARSVSITQPAITQGLAKLEAQLAIKLFERHPDGMRRTAAADLFVPRVERALAHIGSARVTAVQMRALLAISQAGTYAGGSDITGLAPPSLHRALSDLALALRAPVVERRGRGISFTETGKRAVRNLRLARAELEAGLAELEGLKGIEVGQISIGAMPLSRARLLPAAVAAFHRRFPEVKISIAEGSFGELIEPLRDGELDMMIGALRHPSPGADIDQRPLFLDRPVIVGRHGHPLATSRPTIRDLAAYSWVVPSAGTPLHILWRLMFDDLGIALPHVPIECGSVITIRQLLISSDFLTLLSPDQVAVELEAKWLDIIAEAPEGLARNIGVSTRAGWQPTMMQAAFLAELEEVARTQYS